MTKVPRRRPAPAAAPVEWPSYASPEPRRTSSGQVSSLPSPVQAMWAEALGRFYDDDDIMLGELRGLAVGLSILTRLTLEQVHDEIERRAQVSVSRSRRGSL